MKVFELTAEQERRDLYVWLQNNSDETSNTEDYTITANTPVGAIVVIEDGRNGSKPVTYVPLTDSQPTEVRDSEQEAAEFYKRDLRVRLATAIPTHNSIDELEAKFQWVWNGTVA